MTEDTAAVHHDRKRWRHRETQAFPWKIWEIRGVAMTVIFKDWERRAKKDKASIPVIKSIDVGFLKKLEVEKDARPCCEKD